MISILSRLSLVRDRLLIVQVALLSHFLNPLRLPSILTFTSIMSRIHQVILQVIGSNSIQIRAIILHFLLSSSRDGIRRVQIHCQASVRSQNANNSSHFSTQTQQMRSGWVKDMSVRDFNLQQIIQFSVQARVRRNRVFLRSSLQALMRRTQSKSFEIPIIIIALQLKSIIIQVRMDDKVDLSRAEIEAFF